MTGKLPLAARIVEVLLGGLFLLAAVLKALDANLFVHQIFLYGVFEDQTLLGMVALVTLFVETVLGLAMVLGLRLRGLVPVAVLALLVFFTGLIMYAWPEDCGCFGKVKMGPEISIAKNIAMMAAGGFILYALRGRDVRQVPLRIGVSVVVGLLASAYAYPQVFQQSVRANATVAAPASPSTPAPSTADTRAAEPAPATPTPAPATPGPYAGYIVETDFGEQLDIGQGDYLVATLSMTCEHCMAAVPTLNELMLNPEMPRLVAFVLEPEPGKMVEFQAMTGSQFPMLNFGNNFLEFSRFMAAAPPRLALVRDGHVGVVWDGEIPDAATIQAAVSAALSGS
ncbi:MAG: hypothetical protein RLZZ303_70 [Candidatus Hydrogenedentota bacterium]|jgi:hypothetical protein